MDKIDKIIKDNLSKQQVSSKYKEMIDNTMKMISNNEIERKSNILDFNQKKKSKLLKFLQPVAVVLIIGVLGVTTYAGVTRKIKYKHWKYWS